MPAVSALLSSGVSVGLLAGVVSGLLYLVVAGLRWAGEAKQQTNHWLYRQARGRYLPAAPSDGAIEPYNGDGMEPEYVRVREFIERLVESMVLGELDNVCIKRLHAHPEYKHMADDDSPSAAHAALKQLVQQIVRDAMTLPNFRGLNHTRDSDECHSEDIDSKTYEDLLATAILNKVIERYQESSGSDRRTVDGNSNLLTPELMSLISTQQPKFISSVEIGINSTSPDDERTLSSDDCERSFDPLSLTIEECIEEEVTTVSNVEDDENDEDADFDVLGVFKNRRTPFPEYGRDIIDDLLITNPEDDIDEDEEDDADSSDDDPSLQPTDVINPVDSWEKNWLFQKRRLKVGGVSQPMPVPMLVPNPSEDFRALIGDRDAEDVSDLSECSDGALEDLVLADVDDSSRNVLPSEVNTKDMCAEWIPDVDTQGDFNSVCRNNSPLEVKQCSEKSKNILLNNAPNGISSCDDLQVTEAKNTDIYKTSAEDCISEFDQQEGEYTEDYAAVTQRQLDSLSGLSDPELQSVPELPASPVPPQSSEQSETASLLNEIIREESENMESPDEMLSKSELGRPPKTGTIAEREHRKWETAPPLPNNPYSPENIQKRLNKKQMYAGISNGNGADIAIDFPELNENSSKTVIDKPVHIVCSPSDVDYKRYGRDYYINTSATSKKQPRNSSEPHLQVSLATSFSVAKLEKQIQNRDVYHSSLRARNASSQFKMNPLYENIEGENFENGENRKTKECYKIFLSDMEQREFVNNKLCIKSMSQHMASDIHALPASNSHWLSKEEISDETPYEKLSFDNNVQTSLDTCEVTEENEHYYFHKDSLPSSENKHTLSSQIKEKGYSESGYSSSLDSLNDSCSSQLRLVPPEKPQMVECTYESLESLRRSGSLKLSARRRKVTSPVFGGSLRILRQRPSHARSALW